MIMDLLRKQQATSMQQCSEWGTRTIQASFPRLSDKCPFETKGEQRIAIKIIVMLITIFVLAWLASTKLRMFSCLTAHCLMMQAHV